MVRKLLRSAVTVTVTVVLAGTVLFGVGAWRRSQDTNWCREAAGEELTDRQRSVCISHRQRQRAFFGAVWRTGGREMAECGFRLAQLQLLTDPEPRRAILVPYGLDPSSFDSGSRADQSRFIQACAAAPRLAG
jgi:hypothetical protein